MLRVLHGPPVPLLPAASSSEHTLLLPQTAANNPFGVVATVGQRQRRLWCDSFCTFVPCVLSEGVSVHTPLTLAVSRLTALHRWCVVKGSAVTSLAGRLRTVATAWASFRNCFGFTSMKWYAFCVFRWRIIVMPLDKGTATLATLIASLFGGSRTCRKAHFFFFIFFFEV